MCISQLIFFFFFLTLIVVMMNNDSNLNNDDDDDDCYDIHTLLCALVQESWNNNNVILFVLTVKNSSINSLMRLVTHLKYVCSFIYPFMPWWIYILESHNDLNFGVSLCLFFLLLMIETNNDEFFNRQVVLGYKYKCEWNS